MGALISSTNPIYAVDNSPTAENTYHARFYFSPNSVSIPKGMVHDLFAGTNATGMAVFRLQIQGVSGGYQMRGLVLTAGNRTFSTGWYPLNNVPQSVEIAWSAAATQNGTDGTLTLWLDGVQKEVRSNLSNGSYRLESVQFGPQNIGAGISGIEYFDQFASSRGTYIGP